MPGTFLNNSGGAYRCGKGFNYPELRRIAFEIFLSSRFSIDIWRNFIMVESNLSKNRNRAFLQG
ncbi:MAG: hypothetical protein CVV44_06135 [Spirochaetae bacterium HGW-Spirochaetae-1]|nr:MAG: hypothetical protein CVV44_06135 [Spirochaetae bacterium HGW-Spirochaetae-1]